MGFWATHNACDSWQEGISPQRDKGRFDAMIEPNFIRGWKETWIGGPPRSMEQWTYSGGSPGDTGEHLSYPEGMLADASQLLWLERSCQLFSLKPKTLTGSVRSQSESCGFQFLGTVHPLGFPLHCFLSSPAIHTYLS